MADPDQDGIDNIVTLTFPNIGDGVNPGSHTYAMDETHLTFIYARSDSALALDPRFEISKDHDHWNEVYHALEGATITVDDDGYGQDANGIGIDKVTVRMPMNDRERLFARLTVNVPSI